MKNILGSEEARWSAVALGSTALAAVVVRWGLKRGWKAWKGDDPPRNPAHPDVTWTDALAWAGATGAAVALARVAARRGAAVAWKRITGTNPPA